MLELTLAMLPFSFSMTITPGPNNIMVTASGANFGFRKTVPHIMGIAVGFPAMTAAIGLGLGCIFEMLPAAHTVLKYGGAAYLAYLAWKIAFFSGSQTEAPEGARPLTFLQAALFQWVNPKAWMMSIGAISTFVSSGDGIFMQIVVISLIFFLTSLPCVSAWAIIGVNIKKFLNNSVHLKIFNTSMASLLVISLVLSF